MQNSVADVVGIFNKVRQDYFSKGQRAPLQERKIDREKQREVESAIQRLAPGLLEGLGQMQELVPAFKYESMPQGWDRRVHIISTNIPMSVGMKFPDEVSHLGARGRCIQIIIHEGSDAYGAGSIVFGHMSPGLMDMCVGRTLNRYDNQMSQVENFLYGLSYVLHSREMVKAPAQQPRTTSAEPRV